MEAFFAVAAIQSVATIAAIWLSRRSRFLISGLPYLVSIAVGVLLATALLHILPDAITALGNRPSVWLVFSATIFVMFCIERIFAAVTGHPVESPSQGDKPCADHHHHSSRPLSLIFGGVLHSAVDGISVAAAFGAGNRIGWLTAAAITLHEVPHRMGDFALLTHLRVPRRRALQMLLLISCAALAGVLLVQVAGRAFAATDWLLPMSSASFVYIGLVNLMPELGGERSLRRVILQLLAMLGGATLVALLLRLPRA